MNLCDAHEGDRCITCSDEATPMRVVSLHGDSVACVDDEGKLHAGIAAELVGPLIPGDRVLVHAGVAIA